MCVLLQVDNCEEVGIQLVQTLTVVFPPPIRGGLIGKPPLFQLSTPNFKSEANLPEFRVPSRCLQQKTDVSCHNSHTQSGLFSCCSRSLSPPPVLLLPAANWSLTAVI